MKRTLIIVIVLLIVLAAAGWYWHAHTAQAPVTGQYVVTLTDNGFVPAELHIMQGQTVTFRTTSGKPYWPASNPHPAHTDYPQFDPQDPIKPDATWSFTFERVGTWGYHDHLAPYFTGTIVVSPAGASGTPATTTATTTAS